MRSQFWFRGPVEKKNQKKWGPGTSYKHDFSHRFGKYKRQLKKLHRIFYLKKSLNWVRIRSFFIFSVQPDPVLRKSIKNADPEQLPTLTSDARIRKADPRLGLSLLDPPFEIIPSDLPSLDKLETFRLFQINQKN